MIKIKRIIKKIIGYKRVNYMRVVRSIYRSEKKNTSKFSILNILVKTKTISDYKELFETIELTKEYKRLYYSIDKYKTYFYNGNTIANLMIDYNKILDRSLNDFKDELDSSVYSTKIKKCIDAIELLLDREIEIVKKDKYILESLSGIKYRKANSFKDALQRILFYNQLMWQTGHYLSGIGRLDYILIKYYNEDIDKKIITREEGKELIKEFLSILHNDFYFKSNGLNGDTGQIIILGGIDEKGRNIENELTYLFIETIKEMQLPDPKLLLRVNKNTSRELIAESLKCIKTGIGCPLLANDDVIIPKLILFGVEQKDVYNYGTSACWEPFITGKSLDQNNLELISFMEPLDKLINKSTFFKINSKQELVERYKEELLNYLEKLIKKIDNMHFGEDNLLSLLTDNCIKKGTDISKGGAKYNDYGFTGVGISNVVNSILSISKYVFEERKFTLKEFNKIRLDNFSEYESLVKEIKNKKEKYGVDDEEVIKLTNTIINTASEYIKGKTNSLGGKYKFGLSSPSYIDASEAFPASFDGRKRGEPFGVHISSDNANGYTELVNFACKLDLPANVLNGNVIDFFVSPNLIEDNFEKFIDFIILSIKSGFFEMQMNVVNSKKLIEARREPDKFPNLIVRVWGFSTYFKDLPDNYKDYLIERALRSEGKSY